MTVSRLHVIGIVLLLSLVLPSQTIAPWGIETARAQEPPTEVDSPEGHSHIFAVDVNLSLDDAPAVDKAGTLTVSITPVAYPWNETTNATITLEALEGINTTTGSREAVLEFNQPLSFDVPLTPTEVGQHYIVVKVTRLVDGIEELGRKREGWFDLPTEGAGSFHLDALPPTGYASVGGLEPGFPRAEDESFAEGFQAMKQMAEPGPVPGVSDRPSMDLPPEYQTAAPTGSPNETVESTPATSSFTPTPEQQAASGHPAGSPENATQEPYDPAEDKDASWDSGVVIALSGNIIFQDPFNQASLDTSKWSVVNSGYSIGMSSSSLRMTVREQINTVAHIRSITTVHAFTSTSGIDAEVDMARYVAGTGFVAKPEFRIERSDNTNVWVSIWYNPYYGRIEVRDSAGTNLLVASDSPVGYHHVRILLTGTSYTAYYDSSSITVSSSLFNGASGFKISMIDTTGGSTTGATETSARQSLVVSEYSTGASSTFKVSGCWKYENEINGLEPQRWATYEVWDEDIFSTHDLLASGITGDDGCFLTGNIARNDPEAGNQDVYLKFQLCNSATCVTSPHHLYQQITEVWTHATSVNSVGSEAVQNWGNVPLPSSGLRDAGRVFQHLNNAWVFASNHGFTEVTSRQSEGVIPCPYTTLSLGFACDGYAYYALPSDLANYVKQNTMNYPFSLSDSPDIIVHEWGHFVMDKAYNDNWPTDDPYDQNHSWCGSARQVIAWQEGFADFIGARVNFEVAAPNVGLGYSDDRFSSSYIGGGQSVENGSCGGGSDSYEGNIARALWDLADTRSFDDGSPVLDRHYVGTWTIYDVLDACNDASYREFYDGGTCNWNNVVGQRCAFVETAYQNGVNYNALPSGALYTQTSFGWYRGSVTAHGDSLDPDGCTTGSWVEFRMSHDSTCNSSDTPMGQDFSSPYIVALNTAGGVFTDDSSVWTCALPNDAMAAGPWVVSSSSIGIDNTIPSSATVTVPTSAQALAYTVSYAGADALSGLQSLQLQESATCVVNLSPCLIPGGTSSYTTVCSASPGGATSWSTSCSRNPSTPANYCYRTVAYDRVGNVRTGTASCILNLA